MKGRPSAVWIAFLSALFAVRPREHGEPAPAKRRAAPSEVAIAQPLVVEAPVRLPECPRDMAALGASCIDRYEAPNVQGAKPLVMLSAFEAEAWCRERGKRLCTEAEWELACEGPPRVSGTDILGEAPRGREYPYGEVREEGACNDGTRWIEYDQELLNMWPDPPGVREVERLYQGAPSGSHPRCVSPFGVYDLLGNVEEWVFRSPGGRFEHALKGCYWAGCFGGSKPSCASTNYAHARTFRFYEIGFRCCMDAR